MTVSKTTSRWASVGDGVTVDFSYDNLIFAATDLEVYLDGVLQSSGYTVSGLGDKDGGNVTFDVAPAVNVVVLLIRNVPATQPTKYPPGGPFPETSVEKAQDRLTILVQQVMAENERMLGLSETDDYAGSMDLPTGATSTAQALMMSDTGFTLGPTADEVSSAEAYANNASASATAAATSEGNAATSETNAASSAADAAASAASVTTFSYQGTWNASTNTPTIPAAAAANAGHYYIVSTAGSTNVDGETDWQVSDWIVSNGATWEKIDNSLPALALLANQAKVLTAGYGITGGTLTDGATVTPDFNASNAFDWTLSDSRTLAFPTIITGQTKGMMYIDATASGADRTITLGSGLTLQGGNGLVIPSGSTYRVWIVLQSGTAGHVYTEALQ